MKLLIASNNAHKVAEIRAILLPYFNSICSLASAELSIEVEEDGKTFIDNAIKKAEETLRLSDDFDAVLGDDSGLMVDALNGAPGVYSARYAGSAHDTPANNQKLMRELEGVPFEQRTAHFVTAVALARRNRPTLTAEGHVDGCILTAPHGSNGFGYDPYFYYPPFQKSFAELDADEKNGVSHRHNALLALELLLANEHA